MLLFGKVCQLFFNWSLSIMMMPKKQTKDQFWPHLYLLRLLFLSWYIHNIRTQYSNMRPPVAAPPPWVTARQGQRLCPALHTICLSWLTFGPCQRWNLTYVGGGGGRRYLHFVFWMTRGCLFFLSQRQEIICWLKGQDISEERGGVIQI